MSLLHRFPRIRRVKDDEEVERLIAEAAADKHATIMASHVVEKDGQVIGHLSIGEVPMVLVWMHQQRARARDSAAVLNFIENNFNPGTVICVPCPLGSPFHPRLVEEGSYKDFGPSTLFFKRI